MKKAATSPVRKARRGQTKFRPFSFPGEGSLTEIYTDLLALPNVHGCFVGQKIANKRRSRKLAIVCCVTKKVADRDLPAAAHIPKRIRWLGSRSKYRLLTTDVQVAKKGKLQAAMPVVGPGDELMRTPSRNQSATLGIALNHPVLGHVVTTAGHAFMGSSSGTQTFGPAAGIVNVSNRGVGAAGGAFSAIPLKAVRIAEADYALLQPQATPSNLYGDALNVSGPHFAGPEDIGTRLLALTATGVRITVLRGVHGTLSIGNVQMRGLLFTDNVTAGGDSGCCLVDADFAVWGLLVGEARINGVIQSVFSSASFVLALENAQLI